MKYRFFLSVIIYTFQTSRMSEKLITKSFERLLDKGKHRGFITYEEIRKIFRKKEQH